MAPLTRRRKRALAAAPPVIDPADRLTRLPDEILAQILSSLPAQEAVRTCVLARAWRDVWKFTRRLRITGGTVKEVQEFVDRLLRLRLNGLKCAPLDECEIKLRMAVGQDIVNPWIRTSLKYQVQTLRILNEDKGMRFDMSNSLLISPHLTRLELSRLWFDCPSLNLGNGCPALEHLEINDCGLTSLSKIMSPSLKHMVITDCYSNNEGKKSFKISAPRLVSLWLEVGKFRAPLLESMPELVEAHVRIASPYYGHDHRNCDDPMGTRFVRARYCSDSDFDTDVDSENEEDYPEGCVLLEGLAQAKHLVLLAHHQRYIFRRDLRICPTFSNLKTLVLNDYWCEPADCHELACILGHAPVLENLTVVFSEKVELDYNIVLKGRQAKSTMNTQCLETVKVKFNTVNEGVVNVLKFMSTLNICLYAEMDKEQLVEVTNLVLKLEKDFLAAQHTRHGGNLLLTDGEPQDPEEDAL